MKYNPVKIEPKWQKYWKSKKLYNTKDSVKGKENKVLLTEFPYPSGNLHIGHWYAFALPDIKARYLRMRGYNVLYPIGFDAFGLPAENAAIKNDTHPQAWTKKNIAFMTRQLESMGATFDWSRKVETIDPEYYKWTQWMFLEFYKKGLAYRAVTKVNWCPKDKTVLANEQVVDGKCDRCGSQVTQKDLAQWMFKITDFKDALIDDLESLDWQDTAKLGQINWIGRSEGAKIKFNLKDIEGQSDNKHSVEVFTTRADTLFGVSAVVISPELAQKWIDVGWKTTDEVKNYIKKSLSKRELERQEEKEKTGVDAGIKAINPINNNEIPVWVADYVLGGYGTGAVMMVPAHDERDFEFAKQLNLPIRHVVIPRVVDHINPPQLDKPSSKRINVHAIVYNPKNKKYLILRNDKFGWDTVVIGGVEEGEDFIEAAKREVREEAGYVDLEFKKILGGPVQAEYFAKHKNENRIAITTAVLFELKSDKTVALAEDVGNQVLWVDASHFVPGKMVNSELPYWLERLNSKKDSGFIDEGFLINSENFNGLKSQEAQKKIVQDLSKDGMAKFEKTYRLRDWILSRQRYWGVPIPMINCSECGYIPVQEEDLPIKLPPLKDYKPADDGRSPLAKAEKWLKVKCPKCGAWAERETDTMDTFVDSSWYFIRYADPNNKKTFASKEKMSNWLPVFSYLGGAEHTTMHLLYSRFFTKALYSLGFVNFNEPFLNRRNRGIILGPDGQKMSKSRGNVIDPDIEVKKFGADTVRMYLAFMGPYLNGGPWDPNGIVGVSRFLNRVWNYFSLNKIDLKLEDKKSLKVINKAIYEIGKDIDGLEFNTGVSGLMKLLNSLESIAKEGGKISKEAGELFCLILAPFAPHLAEEIWQTILKNKNSVHLKSWPQYDESLLADDLIKLAVQINGKMRDVIEVGNNLTEDEVKKLVMGSDKVKKHLEGKEIKKFIYIPGRVVNLVV